MQRSFVNLLDKSKNEVQTKTNPSFKNAWKRAERVIVN